MLKGKRLNKKNKGKKTGKKARQNGKRRFGMDKKLKKKREAKKAWKTKMSQEYRNRRLQDTTTSADGTTTTTEETSYREIVDPEFCSLVDSSIVQYVCINDKPHAGELCVS